MRYSVWLLICSCFVCELCTGLVCYKCSATTFGDYCFKTVSTAENCTEVHRKYCGTITDYTQQDGVAFSTPVGIERGCFLLEVFEQNPGCTKYPIAGQTFTVSTCTRNCNSDYCNNWEILPRL